MPPDDVFDVGTLPPVQYLIMEVLAARYRLGESHWTFPSSVTPHVRRLAALGLVHHMHGIVERTVRAMLTDAGRKAALWDGYTSPGDQDRTDEP